MTLKVTQGLQKCHYSIQLLLLISSNDVSCTLYEISLPHHM